MQFSKCFLIGLSSVLALSAVHSVPGTEHLDNQPPNNMAPDMVTATPSSPAPSSSNTPEPKNCMENTKSPAKTHKGDPVVTKSKHKPTKQKSLPHTDPENDGQIVEQCLDAAIIICADVHSLISLDIHVNLLGLITIDVTAYVGLNIDAFIQVMLGVSLEDLKHASNDQMTQYQKPFLALEADILGLIGLDASITLDVIIDAFLVVFVQLNVSLGHNSCDDFVLALVAQIGFVGNGDINVIIQLYLFLYLYVNLSVTLQVNLEIGN